MSFIVECQSLCHGSRNEKLAGVFPLKYCQGGNARKPGKQGFKQLNPPITQGPLPDLGWPENLNTGI
jgi:hypothetical protein